MYKKKPGIHISLWQKSAEPINYNVSKNWVMASNRLHFFFFFFFFFEMFHFYDARKADEADCNWEDYIQKRFENTPPGDSLISYAKVSSITRWSNRTPGRGLERLLKSGQTENSSVDWVKIMGQPQELWLWLFWSGFVWQERLSKVQQILIVLSLRWVFPTECSYEYEEFTGLAVTVAIALYKTWGKKW